MQTLYKLTDMYGYTRRGEINATLWEPGWIYEAVGKEDQPLCSDGWLHAYEDLLVGVFLNPIHADIKNPRALECQGEVGARDGELKCGCRILEAVRWVECPQPTTEQRVRFGIGCTWKEERKSWRKWARRWLTGEDRTKVAARAAHSEAATEAAWAAARAADAEAAAEAAWATWAADAEAAAARAVARAARSAARAAAWAEKNRPQTNTALNLRVIAAWAMTNDPIEKLYPEEEE